MREGESLESGSRSDWPLALATLGLPGATWLALGLEGTIVLVVPQAVIVAALWLGPVSTPRVLARAFLVAGLVGAILMTLAHSPGARRPVGAFLLLGSFAGSVAGAFHVLRHGRGRIGVALAAATTLYVALGVAVVILQSLAQ